MAQMTADQARQLIEKNLRYALRVLRDKKGGSVGLAHRGFEDMTETVRNDIVAYASNALWQRMRGEVENARKTARETEDDEQDLEETGFVMDEAAQVALIGTLHATAWTKDKVINEALKFMWMALQSQLAPAGASD